MDISGIIGIDIMQIAELTTSVATVGAIRALEIVGDDLFEYTVAIIELVYETNPD